MIHIATTVDAMQLPGNQHRHEVVLQHVKDSLAHCGQLVTKPSLGPCVVASNAMMMMGLILSACAQYHVW
jgi:hypothetical protein